MNINIISLNVIIISYLIGSIPFSFILAKIFYKKDLRIIGSKNVGATNVLRNFGKTPGIISFLFDMAKGFLATYVVYSVYGVDYGNYASISVVIGHIFPIWLKFKGGKGVATTIGVIAAISWPLGVLIAAFWVSVFIFTRISSISSICSILISPILLYIIIEAQIIHLLPLWIPGEPSQIQILTYISILVVLMHKDNLYRIIYKKEPKV